MPDNRTTFENALRRSRPARNRNATYRKPFCLALCGKQQAWTERKAYRQKRMAGVNRTQTTPMTTYDRWGSGAKARISPPGRTERKTRRGDGLIRRLEAAFCPWERRLAPFQQPCHKRSGFAPLSMKIRRGQPKRVDCGGVCRLRMLTAARRPDPRPTR